MEANNEDAPQHARFWQEQARRYDRAVRLLNRRFDEMARAVASSVQGCGEVLEVAAGTGLVSQRLAPKVGRLVATDTSTEMLKILEGRLNAGSHSNVEIRIADAQALAFDDQTFDAVVMANLLHLLPEPALALREARRVLRPGGVLCAPTFCHGEHLLAHGVSRVLAMVGFPVVTRFSGDSFGRLFKQEGLRVQERQRFPGVLPLCFIVARRDLRAPASPRQA